jgi:RNA polymerase sigma-70 factor, ECF subfamily
MSTQPQNSREELEAAYRRLVEPHRAELHAHCYRMLGSLDDAEDALQESLLRAWRGLPGFEGRSSVRTWLYTIATNACLRVITRRRQRRVLPVDGAELEAIRIDPYPDQALGLAAEPAGPEARYEQRESVELAFIAALQHLPARQRAVLILRDVLGFSAREVAESLETTRASVNSALQRARSTVDERLPARSQQATLRSLGDERLRDLVARYVEAWERGDAQAILAMLADDAAFAMPPEPSWFRGRDEIAAFLPVGPLTDRWRFVPVRASGQQAFGTYSWDGAARCYVASAIDVLTLRGSRVQAITAFLYPDLFARFGLPDRLPER